MITSKWRRAIFLFIIAYIIPLRIISQNAEQEYNCGIISFWNCARLLGAFCSLEELDAFIEGNEVSFYELYLLAEKMGLRAQGVKMTGEEVMALTSPCVAQIKGNHFVTIDRVFGDKILLNDCFRYFRLYTQNQFEEIFDGYVLIVSKPNVNAGETKTAPQIAIDRLIYNFGIVEKNSSETQTFRIFNSGGKDLKINKLDNERDTIDFYMEKDVIEPGGFGDIYVTVYFPEKEGFIIDKVDIHSNDPNRPLVTINLYSFVDKGIHVNPGSVQLGKVIAGHETTTEVYVTDSFLYSDDIIFLNASSDFIHLEKQQYERLEDNVSRWLIKVSVDSDKMVGSFNEKIYIHTNSRKTPFFEVPISGSIVKDITTYPRKLLLFQTDDNDETGEAIIYSMNKKPFRITRCERRNIPLNFRIKLNKDDCYYIVEIACKDSEGVIAENPAIEIHIDREEQKIIHIPVWYLRKQI